MFPSKNFGSKRGPVPELDCDIPKLNAQFFYSSSLPIDDPLSAVPNSAGADVKSLKHPLLPFSSDDNEALEEAWHSLISIDDGNFQKNLQNSGISSDYTRSKSLGAENVRISSNLPKDKASKERINHAVTASHLKFDDHQTTQNISRKKLQSDQTTNCESQKLASTGLDTNFSEEDLKENSRKEKYSSPKIFRSLHISKSHQDVSHKFHSDSHKILDLKNIRTIDDRKNLTSAYFNVRDQIDQDQSSKYFLEENSDRIYQVSSTTKDSLFCDQPKDSINSPIFDTSPSKEKSDQRVWEAQATHKFLPSKIDRDHVLSKKARHASSSHTFKNEDAGTTGKPFVKLPSRPCSPSKYDRIENDEEIGNKRNESHTAEVPWKDFTYSLGVVSDKSVDKSQVRQKSASRVIKNLREVPVGISRLHFVLLPNLKMKPIYWSPVKDTASVIRGTWFYHDTIYPVEPAVANQLELGYRELRPWTQTWKDELESALAVGAAGEEKIAYRLWPNDREAFQDKLYEQVRLDISSNPYRAAKNLGGDIAAECSTDSEVGDDNLPEPKTNIKKYSTALIIYKDSNHAFILKPNLQPSAYYGRKPLQKIIQGTTVGIPVIRGFDWKMWDRLHPTKKFNGINNGYYATLACDTKRLKLDNCSNSTVPNNRVKATDLVLVVHGIGQKLSERIESFNFTHAVNEFRRSINVEMCNSSVKQILRKDGVGIMVLPVNWRSSLSFEDGGLMKDDHLNRSRMDYSLNDVTQKSLPAVRQMISDVMLDIPYYMSRHKPKMIQAVIQEANRVYRLWCKNNRDFEKEGRVHLIAHSLGSVMTLEILSKQPTLVPKLDLDSKNINAEYFDFRTTNCFFAGSPAGFFLLLEEGKLLPRRGINKPDAEDFNDKSVTGEAGTFGCMALDNIYNVIHFNDPIAYRLNATVDRKYAEGLKEAQLPTTTVGLFESIGRAMRSITPGIVSAHDETTDEEAESPSRHISMAHLPANMEMEVHDFSREEIAEKKFNLLNDNGQIDWYMNSGRGPLEIQYINMLGAHSSYWVNPDFVRMVLVECGRKPGKNNTLAKMKAVRVTRIGSHR
ncbi:putative ddhd domain protein [Golovinomyces cichoracearum]|uniref:Putative ddhd domain protein n=1 Tax=Golovinomyces cichoracearum TaxID=62708 RepID=A0A420IQW3_9PEZI|nr:putative ddhd domain protein [Golovinomyces cichoracearum]